MNSSPNLNNVIELIQDNIDSLYLFIGVYLFGSIINNPKPNDIDILLIYKEFSPELFHQKNELNKLLKKKMAYYSDITILSNQEEKEIGFLDRLNRRYVKIK